MKIKEIMIYDVTFVKPDTLISEVADLIFKNNYHGVPVVENNKVIGIITEDDFFLKNYDDLFLPSYIQFLTENKATDNLPANVKDKIKKLLGARAKDIMSSDIITVSDDMDVESLMKTIKETKYTTFPVTDKEKNIKGIVTLSDILGIVRKGSGEMGRAMKKRGELKDIELLAKEIHSSWGDKFVMISRKKVQSWKGMVFISTIAAVTVILSAIYMENSKKLYNFEGKKNKSALDCVKYTYTDWSPCVANGSQTRQIIDKLPKGCEGGALPELARRCQ
jgi:CBS domain-containing protein